jgi:FtsP/CotA-like multicopper oxidase with cupredoxin domain
VTPGLLLLSVSPAGTHWMHSHQELQEAFLLAAPLIVHDAADRQRDEQEVVIFLFRLQFHHANRNLRKAAWRSSQEHSGGEVGNNAGNGEASDLGNVRQDG